MKKITQKTITDPIFALDICQRNLDRGYVGNNYGDDEYDLGYACCLKDISYLLLGSDDGYGIKDKK